MRLIRRALRPPAAKLVREVARRAGFELVRLTDGLHPLARRKRLLATYNINLVLDVGANTGQYAQQLRNLDYRGRIISFEPLSTAFAELRRNQKRAPRGWEVLNVALGERAGRAEINVTANSFSSSFLPMLPAHSKIASGADVIGREEVAVVTLDSIIEERVRPSERVFLKSDTQGYEAKVLAGAARYLDRIRGIQLEMSLVPLYEGELLFEDMIRVLAERGFTLMSLEPGFGNQETGQLLQADGLFFRHP